MDEKRKPALAFLCLILAVLMVFAMMPGMAYAGVKKNAKLKNITGRVKDIPSTKMPRFSNEKDKLNTVVDTDLSVEPGNGVDYDVAKDQTETKGNVYVKPGASFNVQEKIDCTYLDALLVRNFIAYYCSENEQNGNADRSMKGKLNVHVTVPKNITVQTDQIVVPGNDAVTVDNSSIKSESNNDGTITYTIPLSVNINSCSEYTWAALGPVVTLTLPMKMNSNAGYGVASKISSSISNDSLLYYTWNITDYKGQRDSYELDYHVTDKQAKGGTYNEGLTQIGSGARAQDEVPYDVMLSMAAGKILQDALKTDHPENLLTENAYNHYVESNELSKMSEYTKAYTTKYGDLWEQLSVDQLHSSDDLQSFVQQLPIIVYDQVDYPGFVTVDRLLSDGTDFTETDKSSTATQLTIRTPYKVTFHQNNGENDIIQSVKNGKTAEKPTDPTRNGYEFEGWYTDSACTNTYDFNTPVNSNLDLYAKWTKKAPVEHTVTFHPNNGQNNSTQTVTDGSKVTKPTDPTRDGYKFEGWYTDSDLKNAYDFSKTVTSDLDLYAKWTKIETPVTPVEDHTVTFHPANGQSNFTQAVADGNKAVKPTDPTQNGYTFNGWYTDSALTNAYDFDTPVNKDIDLYAKWTKNTPAPTPETDKVTGILLPKVIANGSNEQTFTWTPLTNVDGYFVYEAYCNTYKHVHPFKKVADVSASSPRVYKRSGLKKGIAYKYYVAAYKKVNGKKQIVKKSVSVHSAAGNLLKKKNAKYTNVKKVSVNKNAVTLKIGKIYKIQPSVKGVISGCSILQKDHAPMYRYLYIKDGKNISVNQNGTVKALKAGKCNVYVLGTNGVRTKVAVTVVK